VHPRTRAGLPPHGRHRFTPAAPSPELRALRFTAYRPRERTTSPDVILPSQGSSPSTASSVQVAYRCGPSALRP
jgi:hypothetical protein